MCEMNLLSLLPTESYATPLIVGLFTALLCFIAYRRPKNYPPGPRGFPLVGVLPSLGKNTERVFQKWSQKYGGVISVPVGMKDWVVLNDHESVHEALVKNKENISGRPRDPVIDIINQKKYGIALLDYGPQWKAQRKFGIHTLRGFGVGKKSMEERVIEEASYLCKAIQEFGEQPFDIKESLQNAIANNICSVTFGKRFEYNNPKFIKVLYHLTRNISDAELSWVDNLVKLAPFLKHFPPFSNYLNALQHDMDVVHETLQEIVDEHKATLDPENPRDFIDAFLLEMNKNKDDTYTEKQLGHYAHDLFFAGTETTTSTLRWAILVMLHYPEAQKKLRKEIRREIGESSMANYSDRTRMPYTSAFMEELYRFRTLAPFGLPHKTTGKVTVGGFEIPAETQVMPNIWAVHNDPRVFEQPEVFKAERHLDGDGNFVKSSHVIPFSLGPRHCLGEQLARMEVFIFLVSLVQKFEFRPVTEGVLPEINDGSNSGAFIPLPFQVVAKES